MTLSRPHNLPIEVLRARVEALRSRLNNGFRFVSTWTGDTLKIVGAGFKGTMKLLADRVELEAQLGVLLKSFTAQIESALELELDKLTESEAARG